MVFIATIEILTKRTLPSWESGIPGLVSSLPYVWREKVGQARGLVYACSGRRVRKPSIQAFRLLPPACQLIWGLAAFSHVLLLIIKDLNSSIAVSSSHPFRRTAEMPRDAD